ncbi:hypothetical protein B0H21DRAFT_777694 [Amylocystis lapponica]|nr:hypothetical protein B0H21DRAFT_777694 [Amylocystis lapponica]
MSNTVMFPSATNMSRLTLDTNRNSSALSLAHHASALEVCDMVYGASLPAWESIERFYETNAKYENPLVTATSRAVIGDIHALANHFGQLDVPRPAALLYGLFGLTRERGWGDPWFKAMNMWNEVTEISESESFDGHRRTIVEHTVHILILPDLYSSTSSSTAISHPLPSGTSDFSVAVPSLTTPHRQYTSTGSSGPPSLLHLRLPIITRLSFNDAGRIIHHRDFWDIKDVLSLLPGMTLAQWVTSRIVAQGIRGIVGASRALLERAPSRESGESPDHGRCRQDS